MGRHACSSHACQDQCRQSTLLTHTESDRPSRTSTVATGDESTPPQCPSPPAAAAKPPRATIAGAMRMLQAVLTQHSQILPKCCTPGAATNTATLPSSHPEGAARSHTKNQNLLDTLCTHCWLKQHPLERQAWLLGACQAGAQKRLVALLLAGPRPASRALLHGVGVSWRLAGAAGPAAATSAAAWPPGV